MKESVRMVEERKKRIIKEAVQWLKERGVNPHINYKDVKWLSITDPHESRRAVFDTNTGRVVIPYSTILLETTAKGTVEHELFHRADYMEKFWGSKKLRRLLYKKWTAAKEIKDEIDVHEEIFAEILGNKSDELSEKHPLYQAAAEMGSKGYDVYESIVKLYSVDPAKFKDMFREATVIWAAEVTGNTNLDKSAVQEIKKLIEEYSMLKATGNTELNEKRIQELKKRIKEYFMRKATGDTKLDKKRIQELKKRIKEYFMRTPVKTNRKLTGIRSHYTILTEVPAYIIGEYIRGNKPEEGLRTAEKKITSTAYFGGTELEKVARDVVNNYKQIVKTLRKAGCNDEEVIKGVLYLHKNIYTPKDLERLLEDEETIIRAAKAVKVWRGTEDIREGIAAQGLGRMDKNVTKVLDAIKKKEHQKKNSMPLNQK